MKYMQIVKDEQGRDNLSDEETNIIQDFISICKENKPTEFIDKKKYDEKIIEKLGIGLCDNEAMSKLMNKHDKEKLRELGFFSENHFKYLNRIIIPHNKSYFSARTLDPSLKKNLFPKGIKKKPFLINNDSKEVFVVEGETDAIALYHCFPDKNIISLGGALSIKPLKELDNYNKIYFCFDNDEEGKKALTKAANLLKYMDLYKLEIPEDYKDIDEYYLKKGIGEVQKLKLIQLTEHKEIYTVEELLVDGPPKIEWLVDKVMRKKGITIFGGGPGSYKTWVGMHMATCVANGEQFLSYFDTQKGTVFYIDEENGDIAILSRFGAIKQGHKVKLEDFGNIHLSVFNNFKLDDEIIVLQLKNLIKRYKPDLIIFDSLVRCMVGVEDKAEDVRKIFDNLKEIISEFNVSILILHHTAKHTTGLNSLRGSGDIAGFSDSVIMFKVLKDNSVRMDFEKCRHIDKSKFQNINFKLVSADEEGEEVRFELLGVNTESITKKQECFNEMMDWIDEERIKHFKSKLARTKMEELGYSKSTYQETLKDLVSAGNINQNPIKKGYYDVCNPVLTDTEQVK